MSKNQLVRTFRTLSIESKNFTIPRTLSHHTVLTTHSKKEEKLKTRIILTLLFAIALTSSITLMVASFLPVFVDKTYDGAINLLMTGLIIR